MENTAVVLQREVQRKLGRCLLRLQQYERLLKAMVATMSLAGPLEQLDAIQDKQIDGVRKDTLGKLVDLFTKRHLTAEAAEIGAASVEDTSVNDMAPDRPWFRKCFTISMSPEQHAETKADLAELVAMRNDLVHHLIERFDISDETACRSACSHLDSCYERIDDHGQRLKAWATSVAQAQASLSSFMQSKEFDDVFVHALNPDGTVCWSRSLIVECLRSAEKQCHADGWTPLDAAIRVMTKENQDQVPGRYGCKTWRQVLKQSGQFEVRRSSGSDGEPGHTWYRSMPTLKRQQARNIRDVSLGAK